MYITLKFLREYRTMDSIAAEYGVCKGAAPALRPNGWKMRWLKTAHLPCLGKKRCALKMQVTIERDTMEILDVQEAKGSERDFKIYKESVRSSTSSSMPIDAVLDILG
ncbi:MAG: hypothetical protein LBK73_15960 [Treponema sp.]|nr:hypothetical protein [Treponema sp.]